MTPPPPVGEYSIVTFCLLLNTWISTADKKVTILYSPTGGGGVTAAPSAQHWSCRQLACSCSAGELRVTG